MGKTVAMERIDLELYVPAPVTGVLKRLTDAGFPSYLVGGCVRDALLGISPKDFDITTKARPDETARVLSDCRIIPTGIKHGTLTVISGGVVMEITTFRKEGAYSDCRHPDSVEFTDRVEDDLARRDFTVNAMCCNCEGTLVDMYGGADDLRNGVIRTVGAAEKRFSEDALRILRGLRFAARFGFLVESDTERAMQKTAPLMKMLASERVVQELLQIVKGKYADMVLSRYGALLGFVFGGEGEVLSLCTLPSDFRLPALIAGYGGSFERATRLVASLKPSAKLSKQVKCAAMAIYTDTVSSTVGLARAARGYGVDNAENMCLLAKSVGRCPVKGYREYLKRLDQGEKPLHLRDLQISGKDLEKNSLATGRVIGALLEKLYDFVHLGGENEKTALLNEALRLSNNGTNRKEK